eukprot:SAG31_NODE_2033_length_6618_cov_3.628624_8_plen_95_part_00
MVPATKRSQALCDRETGVEYDVDAQHFGNEARFINDYHNVPNAGGQANVEFTAANCVATGGYFVAVMTKKRVKKGQEFLVDYGEQYFSKLSGSD